MNLLLKYWLLLFHTFFLIVIGDFTNAKELQRNHIVYYENGGKNYLTELNFHLSPVGRAKDAPFSILLKKSTFEYTFDWKIDPDIEQDDMVDRDNTIKERPEKYSIHINEPDIGATATVTYFLISKNLQILGCDKDPQKICKEDIWNVRGVDLSLISKVQIEYDFGARKISSYAILKDGRKFLHFQQIIQSSKDIFQLYFQREKFAPNNDRTINSWFSTLQLSFDSPPAFTFADNFQNELVVDHTPRPLFDLFSSTTSTPSTPLSSTSSNGHSVTEETSTLQNHGITNPSEPKNGNPTSDSLKVLTSNSESDSNDNLIYIIVGIICALLLIIIIIIVVICVCRKKKKKLNQPKPNPATSPPANTKQHNPVVANKAVKNKKKNTNDEPFNSVT